MEYKVISWPMESSKSKWLVAVTGKDGSYTPIMELHPTGKATEPTYNNQLFQAANLLARDGMNALNNPHAATGSICGCESCFCCAALEVATLAKAVIR